MLRTVLVLGLLTGLLAHLGWSDEPKKESDKKIELKTRAEKATSAITTDFGATFGLSFPSLTSLGLRIEQARQAPDPIGLAFAASELAVAEKVSKKAAPITSKALLTEALALGELRENADELLALAAIVQDETLQKKLEKAATAAKLKAEETPRGIAGVLVVHNHSHHMAHIHVNGHSHGYVRPHSHRYIQLHAHGHVDLTAHGGGHRWHRHVQGHHHHYDWYLNE